MKLFIQLEVLTEGNAYGHRGTSCRLAMQGFGEAEVDSSSGFLIVLYQNSLLLECSPQNAPKYIWGQASEV